MAYPQERRTQVFTSPRYDNRPFRKGAIKGYSQTQSLNPRLLGYDAAAMLEDEIGIKADSQGNWGSTRDYGRDMLLGSQQRNSMSRGTKGGYASNLGTPLNSNLTPRGFAESIARRNQSLTPGAPVMTREQRIAQAQQEGTFGTIRDKFNIDNEGAGLSMNEFGNIFKPKPTQKTPSGMPLDDALIEKRGFGSPSKFTAAMGSRVSEPSDEMGRRSSEPEDTMGRRPLVSREPKGISGPTAPQLSASQAANRAGLEERAGGLRLLREMSQTPLQIDRKAGAGNDTFVQGKYGTGFATTTPGKKSEGLIGGRPFSEVMQGLANKQVREGTWRSGDRLPEAGWGKADDLEKQRLTKEATEANRQKLLSRQRLAAKNR